MQRHRPAAGRVRPGEIPFTPEGQSLRDRLADHHSSQDPPWRRDYYERKLGWKPPILHMPDAAFIEVQQQQKEAHEDALRRGQASGQVTLVSRSPDEESTRQEALADKRHRALVRSYIESVCWVLRYYYGGCPSWSWFYPYHFAPLVSDLIDLPELGEIAFSLDAPLRPFEQLLGVLPSLSSKLLPAPSTG
eukprot:GAFH01004062.1.p2 GENE.GAFH01004062.1~~GAFH01004062.1.p2  ORF type:complete len:209 (+),score=80.90 GAFH01004062.1:56-628(+)